MPENKKQNTNNPKTVKFFTLGCKVNQYETEAIRKLCLPMFREAGNKELADVYIVNTCTVTKNADIKSIKYIRRAKRENPKAKIIVTGCLAEKDGERIRKEKADFVLPQSRKQDILSLLIPKAEKLKSTWDLKIDNFPHSRAFVKVQDGCDKACSFCKVRIVRGKSISRPSKDIIEEISILSRKGFKEIVLCGINLGSWQEEKKGFIFLVRKILEIRELGRLRLSSLEPEHITDGLISLIKDTPKLCPHLHIPFQSGSDKILKLMNKKYTSKYYFSLLNRIHRKILSCGISCDIMAGFPREEDKDFQDSLDLLKEAVPVKTHIFPYSPREGTASFSFNQLPKDIVKLRIKRLKELSEALSLKFRSSQKGKCFNLILDSGDISKSREGYTENYIRTQINTPVYTKGFVKVKITSVDRTKTYAKVLSA